MAFAFTSRRAFFGEFEGTWEHRTAAVSMMSLLTESQSMSLFQVTPHVLADDHLAATNKALFSSLEAEHGRPCEGHRDMEKSDQEAELWLGSSSGTCSSKTTGAWSYTETFKCQWNASSSFENQWEERRGGEEGGDR